MHRIYLFFCLSFAKAVAFPEFSLKFEGPQRNERFLNDLEDWALERQEERNAEIQALNDLKDKVTPVRFKEEVERAVNNNDCFWLFSSEFIDNLHDNDFRAVHGFAFDSNVERAYPTNSEKWKTKLRRWAKWELISDRAYPALVFYTGEMSQDDKWVQTEGFAKLYCPVKEIRKISNLVNNLSNSSAINPDAYAKLNEDVRKWEFRLDQETMKLHFKINHHDRVVLDAKKVVNKFLSKLKQNFQQGSCQIQVPRFDEVAETITFSFPGKEDVTVKNFGLDEPRKAFELSSASMVLSPHDLPTTIEVDFCP